MRLQANSIIHSVLSEQQWNKGREWIQNIRDTYGEEVMPMIGSKDYKTYVITYYIYNTETGKHDKYEGQCSSFREILEYDTGAGEYHIIGLDLELLEKNLAKNAKEMGEYFMEQLKTLPDVKEVRGLGLLVGFELNNVDAVQVKVKAMEKKLLVTATSDRIIRMVPPLIITKEDCDKAVAILREAIEEVGNIQ